MSENVEQSSASINQLISPNTVPQYPSISLILLQIMGLLYSMSVYYSSLISCQWALNGVFDSSFYIGFRNFFL